VRPFATCALQDLLRLGKRDAGLAAASWQVFCLNGKRDPTLLVEQSLGLTFFVGTTGS